MGIDLYCDLKTYGCSYSRWNELREKVIKSTFNYIQDKYQKDYKLYKELTEDNENWIGNGSPYNFYKNIIIELINTFNTLEKNGNDNIIDNFINNATILVVNALIYFDIGGLYSFCNKCDTEGYYSVGNSVDICQLFELIEPFIKNYDENIHKVIYVPDTKVNNCILYDLFKESIITNRKINIS